MQEESKHISEVRLFILAAVDDREMTPDESHHLDQCHRCLDLFRQHCITIRDSRAHALSN